LRRLPRLQQRGEEWLIALDQARFARRLLELAEFAGELGRVVIRLLLQSLHQLQASHESQALCLNFRGPRPSPVLGIKPTDPGLMQLGCFCQKPLRRQRFAICLHVRQCKRYRTVRMQPPVPRRVLVAVVRGPLGDQIQAWREHHDAKHAVRLPPHLTVCYRPPDAPLNLLEAQVRHAFSAPVLVRLGSVFVLAHHEAPLAVSLHDTEALDAARKRLFDGMFVQMGGRHEWPWHITCVRYGYKRDRDALLSLAADQLALDSQWLIEEISYLELRDGRYEPVAEWDLNPNGLSAGASLPAHGISQSSYAPPVQTDATP
jgi:2'-5' RNA ligase superfamily protein